MPRNPSRVRRKPLVLHYSGMPVDTGGVLAVIRFFSTWPAFRSVAVVDGGFTQKRSPRMKVVHAPGVGSETIGPRELITSFGYAVRMLAMLGRREHRWFHGHSRVGMMVAFWLTLFGFPRALAMVHCYGHHPLLYQVVGMLLGPRLVLLSPQMKRYYGLEPPGNWARCIPGTIPEGGGTVEPSQAGGTLRLAYLGVIVERKGLLTLLQAIAKLTASERPRLTLAVIGGADEHEEAITYAHRCQTFVQEHHLEEVVTFHGWMNAPWDFLRGHADWLVMPSVNEPFALSILEALREGLPVLGSDSGGITDAIRPWQNGLHFRTADPDDLARRLREILQAPAWPSPSDVQRTASPYLVPQLMPLWEQYYPEIFAESAS